MSMLCHRISNDFFLGGEEGGGGGGGGYHLPLLFCKSPYNFYIHPQFQHPMPMIVHVGKVRGLGGTMRKSRNIHYENMKK